MIKLKQPWPHQVRSKEKLRENLRLDILRQLLCVPTGGGKTEIAMSIIVDAYLKGSHTAFICDMQTLVHQTSERFANAGIPHGVAMGQTTHGRNELIQICSAQTLETRGFLTSGMPMIEGVYAERPLKLAILDECHVVRRQLIATLTDKKIPIIGLTATPLTDGLDSIYQAIVNVTTTEKLIKQGYLAPLRVVSPKARVDTKNVRQNAKGEWVREDMSNRVLRIVGEIVPEWERRTQEYFGGPVKTIAFCASVADSEATAEKFRQAGYDFRVIHYRQTSDQKQQIIEAFRVGRHMGLISCIALTKGFDVPEVLCLIDAYPHRKSLSLVIQKLGRVMRIAAGKKYGLVIDHADNYLGFYGPLKAFFAAGVKHLKDTKLKNATRKTPEETKEMKCYECGYVFGDEKPDECPACGAALARGGGSNILEVPGDMGEVDRVDGRHADFDGDWWPEICAITLRVCRGDLKRAEPMAKAKYNEIFGRWPKWGTEFVAVDKEPHPVVAEICYRKWQEWKDRKKAGEAA